MKRLYVDLDGVLADFVAGVEAKFGCDFDTLVNDHDAFEASKERYAELDLFLDLPLLDDALELWEGVKHLNPEILTAVGKNNSEVHAAHKKLWVEKYFGSDVKFHWVKRSWEKDELASVDAFLIDDRSKSLDPFVAAGGSGVLHKNAADSVAAAKAWFA